jgi:hypothetical protein
MLPSLPLGGRNDPGRKTLPPGPFAPKIMPRLGCGHQPREGMTLDRWVNHRPFRTRGSDFPNLLADNTSAFNCRLVPGTDVWAEHAYGLAVDINPFESPEISGGQADPPPRPGPTGHAPAPR